jgi:ABC-2 type transport system ATP-binding protein
MIADIIDNTPNVIDVKGLTKSFDGVKVVDNISLQVKKGEVFGFLGPNGSGKTTTIRLICGLLKPEAGSGTAVGFDVMTESSDIRRHVGYMTQKFSLYDELSIEENLLFVARMYEMPNVKRAVKDTLEQLGLTTRKKQLAGNLSGGWKQRLALGACTMHKPKLLLLDEPTAGVDPKARRAFWDEIHRLASEGITILVSTHYMDEAERCHRLAYLAYGKLIAEGTGADLINQAAMATWRVTGPHLNQMARELIKLDAVETVAPFGANLHVSGANGPLLEKALKPYFDDRALKWEEHTPTLEDVFIHFMGSEEDNMQ